MQNGDDENDQGCDDHPSGGEPGNGTVTGNDELQTGSGKEQTLGRGNDTRRQGARNFDFLILLDGGCEFGQGDRRHVGGRLIYFVAAISGAA